MANIIYENGQSVSEFSKKTYVGQVSIINRNETATTLIRNGSEN